MTLSCNNGCGTPIKFDNKRIGPKGKKIPLNEDRTPHRCPKRPSSLIQCRYCSQPIRFDENVKAESGKMIPLNPDASYHDCPQSPFNLSKNTNNNNDSKKGEGAELVEGPESIAVHNVQSNSKEFVQQK